MVLFLAGAALSGCSEPDTPFAIQVTPATVTLDALGDTRTLKAVVKDEKGVELTGAAVTWTSSAQAVASVSEAGVVTAEASGSADITATAGSASGKAKVTVTQTVTQFEATSGAQQTGTVNQPLPQTLTVRVRDRLNNAVEGAAISFAVSADGGSVSPSSGTTDAQGQASTTWTFSTKSGSFTVTATMSGTALTVIFGGKANPGPAVTLSKAGGDGQYAFRGTRLDTIVAVRVRDQFGNGVPNHLVQFDTVNAGNGTPDSTVALTDTAGVARTGWRMPDAIDTLRLRAIATASLGGPPLIGSPLSFTAISHNLRVTAVTPAPLVESQSATLDGSGFDLSPSANQVTIDGMAATVTAASDAQLTVTVPTSDCKPARASHVRVTVGTIPASPVGVTVNPASFVSLSPGEQTILRDPVAFCFQFPAATSPDSYLIAVQSISEDHANLTAITLSSTLPPGASIASALSASAPAAARQQHTARLPLDPAVLRRLVRHRAAELEQRAFDRINFDLMRAARAPEVRQPPPVGAGVNVGDTIDVRVSSGGLCSNYASITTIVRSKGTNIFFLEDVANPPGGFQAADFTRFTQDFDTKYYPALLNEFGGPGAGGDADDNGAMVAVVTREVNRRGALGFTTSCDLGALDLGTPGTASNGGEFFYVVAPDPTGTINNDTLTLALAQEFMPSVLAHEPVHVIQFNRRRAAGGSMVSIWLAEGQATLGEEIVGHAVEGRTPTTTPLDLRVVLNRDDSTTTDWYSGQIVALSLYFGWDPINQDPRTGRVAEAPHECTWLSIKPANPGPCVGELDPYGASWSLLRYLSDRFGPTFAGTPGGEPGLQQALLDRTENGYALLEAVIGKPIDSLLAPWAAMLFTDDRPGVGSGNPAILLPTWNFYDIYYGQVDGTILIPALRLAPASLPTSAFSRSANVRAGSAYYGVFGGGNRPATAVKARDGTGQILPPHMRYWVVRIR